MGSFEDTRQQRRRTPWIESPLIESPNLSRAAGCRIFLKLDNFQPSGSFKSRGVGNLVLSHASDPANQGKQLHFFIASAGNAGLGASHAARALSYPCTVAVPSNTKPVMVRKLQEAGAHVETEGANLDESTAHMRQLMKELAGRGKNNSRSCVEANSTNNCRGCSGCSGGAPEIVPIELHPFDHKKIWEGVSTMVDELAYQLPTPDDDLQNGYPGYGSQKAIPADAIVCSVGGGGLMNGIIMGLERQAPMHRKNPGRNGIDDDNNKIHIIATETLGAHALAESVRKGSLSSLSGITSQALSLGALRVASKTYENAVSPPPGVKVHSLVLKDSDAARGVLRLAEEQKLLVELACGVSVEAAIGTPNKTKKTKYQQTSGLSNGNGVNGSANLTPSYLEQLIPNFGPNSRVVIVVCGGSNISVEMAAEMKQHLDDGWGNEETEPLFEV